MDLWVLELLRYIRKWTEEIHTSSNKLMHFFFVEIYESIFRVFLCHIVLHWINEPFQVCVSWQLWMDMWWPWTTSRLWMNLFLTPSSPEDCQILHLFSLQTVIGVPFSPIRFSTILKLLNWTWTWSIYLDVLISYCYNARSFLKYFFDFKKVRPSFLKVILEYA